MEDACEGPETLLKIENEEDAKCPAKVETESSLDNEANGAREAGVEGQDEGEAVNGDAGTNGDSKLRRKSTRVRKEPVPLIQEIPGPSKPRGDHAPRYRFFRPATRVYKPSALVDREWTIPEREKLLDAVSKVAPDDYASIADIIGNTKTPAEVRDYLKRIQTRSKEIESRRQNNLFDAKREPHSRHLYVKEDGEAIERWLRVIDHLVSDNDTVDLSKAIPDAFAVIANLEQNQDPGTIRGKRKKPGVDLSAAAGAAAATDGEKQDDEEEDAVDESDDAVAPINYKVIYEYIYALLRGLKPPALDPIESWVILDLISDTATELKSSNLEKQKDYLRCIYRDYCYKTLNLKWSNTSRMIVPLREEFTVRAKRTKMADGFANYMSKSVEEEKGEEETDSEPKPSCSTSTLEATTAEASTSEATTLLNEPSSSRPTTSSIDVKPPLTNGHTLDSNGGVVQIQPVDCDESTFHNIMIGGLTVTKNAQDFGSLFTMNPLGVPISLLNPKQQE